MKRTRRVFAFYVCPVCGGGKRRHIAIGELWGAMTGSYWGCSRHHVQWIAFSPEERRRREMMQMLLATYRPLIEDMLRPPPLWS